MTIIEVSTQAEKEVLVTALASGDFKQITKRRFFFDWKLLIDTCRLYKLTMAGTGDIVGLMALADHPEERRLEIRLLAVSAENMGSGKVYDGIAGCLISYACNDALERYNTQAMVSLLPKTMLRAHYINKYGMTDAGRQIYLEKKALEQIIEKYYMP